MNTRHILLSLLLGASALTASADDWKLVLLSPDGATQVVEMSLIDRIEIRSGLITITQDDGSTLSFPKACFDQLNITDQLITGIQDAKEEKTTRLRVYAMGYTLQVEGIESGAAVSVFDMNGRTVAQTKGNADGTAVIHTESFAKGSYAIRSGRQVLKFLKK